MTVKDIINVTNGKLINKGNINKKIKKIKIDSRILSKNDAFIALKGDNDDGHKYIMDAINKKVSAVIINQDTDIKTKIPIVRVDDTYQALMDLGKYYRDSYSVCTIAVTGSVGKSMTKELISQILRSKYNVLSSEGNFNNHIGLPLTLFNLNHDYNILVTELGMNHKGEISSLSNICQPNVAVITNIGTAHIGLLGSQKDIFEAKMEVTDGIKDGVLVINGDDKFLKKIKDHKNYDVYKAGLNKDNDLYAYDIDCNIDKSTFKVKFNEQEHDFEFNIPGKHLINNVMLAIMIGIMFDIDINSIKKAICNYIPLKHRLNFIKKDDYTIIDDCYNASYESVFGAIDLIESSPLKKMIILGDILELGSFSQSIHKKIGEYLKNKDIEVILVGNATKLVHYELKNSHHFINNERAIKYLENVDLKDKIILIKGSRGMHLEQIKDYLINNKKST